MNTFEEFCLYDKKHVWHPYTKFSDVYDGPEPLPVIERAEGIWLYDVRGNKYMDAISSWWACTLGHSHPRLIRAIQQQSAVLQHSILGNLSNPTSVKLARELARLMPTPDRHVFFSSDGSCSVEASLKMAVQYFHNIGQPEKNRFISLENAYHGDSTGAVAVGYLEHFHKPFRPILFPVERAPVPSSGGQFSETECLKALKETIARQKGQVAAMIVEPLCQGSAGMLLYCPQHLRAMADICKEEGILFICDEIATGMGRTGTMFAFEQAGIDPDIVCVGKGLTSGYLPVSAAIAKDYIYKTFADTPTDNTFYHGHTFGGNPIGTALALETLSVYRDEDILGKAKENARLIKDRLNSMNIEGIKTKQLGVMGAVEFPTKAQSLRARDILRQKGILVRPLGTVLYIMPPLNTGKDELILLLDAIEDCARKASAAVS